MLTEIGHETAKHFDNPPIFTVTLHTFKYLRVPTGYVFAQTSTCKILQVSKGVFKLKLRRIIIRSDSIPDVDVVPNAPYIGRESTSTYSNLEAHRRASLRRFINLNYTTPPNSLTAKVADTSMTYRLIICQRLIINKALIIPPSDCTN